MSKGERILRRREVVKVTGLSISTILRREAAGIFPQSVPLGCGQIGWLASEIEAWIEGCKAARDAEQK